MFRLIKLAVYALIGYALYEFFRGMSTTAAAGAGAQGSRGAGRGGAGQEQQGEGGNSGAGNMQFSGPGEGRREQSEDPSGEAVPHIVGRGVVQR